MLGCSNLVSFMGSIEVEVDKVLTNGVSITFTWSSLLKFEIADTVNINTDVSLLKLEIT